MIEKVELPVFPLGILPIPGERIPLHIFEPRYRQLLSDLESLRMDFGIYYSHALNKDRMGGLVRLEKVLKRYDSGEADIVVNCIDSFILTRFYNRQRGKLYPAGKMILLNAMDKADVSEQFASEFEEFSMSKGEDVSSERYNLHDVANFLDFDITDRLKYVKLLEQTKREIFLRERLRYNNFIIDQEKKVKDNFFLN